MTSHIINLSLWVVLFSKFNQICLFARKNLYLLCDLVSMECIIELTYYSRIDSVSTDVLTLIIFKLIYLMILLQGDWVHRLIC